MIKPTTTSRITTVPVVIAVFMFFSLNSMGQISMSGNLQSHLDSIIDNIPGAGGMNYIEPSALEYSLWKNMMADLMNGNYATVSTQAATVDYDLILFNDVQGLFYVLQRMNSGSKYWGTYVFNPNFCRNLTIQSPHPKKDYNTGKEGVHVFMQSQSAVFCVSGTHRCNHNSSSSCSGNTSVCSGTSEPYKISDEAHNDQGIFQATTEALMEHDPNMSFVQLHGFSKQSTDPYVIMSNGTRQSPTSDDVINIKTHLLTADDSLTFKIAHVDTTWNRLIAFTNVQGRLINESIDACSSNADSTFGRFIHIEQEKTRLRDDITGWGKMAYAISQTFNCQVVGMNENLQIQNSIDVYPNPGNGKIIFRIKDSAFSNKLNITIRNSQGKIVFKNEFNPNEEMQTSLPSTGIYFISVMNPEAGTTSNFKYLML